MFDIYIFIFKCSVGFLLLFRADVKNCSRTHSTTHVTYKTYVYIHTHTVCIFKQMLIDISVHIGLNEAHQSLPSVAHDRTGYRKACSTELHINCYIHTYTHYD